MERMTEAAMRGEEYKPQGETVRDYPEAYKRWCRDNAETIERRWSEGKANPYFIEHNQEVYKKIVSGYDFEKDKEQNTESVSTTFVPCKSIAEAEERAKSYGIRSVDFGDATIDEINVMLSAISEESAVMDVDLDSLRIISKAGRNKGGSYNSDTNEITISISDFRKSIYQEPKTYAEKIDALNSNIARLQEEKEKLISRLGRSKSMDKMLKSEIKMTESRISDIEVKIAKYQKFQNMGYEKLPLTVATTFEDISQQAKAQIHHEFGHYLDNQLGRPRFNEKGGLASEYSQTTRGEQFAEWYSYYRMKGPHGVPADLVKIFQDAERKGAQGDGSNGGSAGRHLQMSAAGYNYVGVSSITTKQQNQLTSRIREIAKKSDMFENLGEVIYSDSLEDGILMGWKNGNLYISKTILEMEDGSTFCPADELYSAFTKLRNKETLTFSEEYAIEGLFHEGVHSKAKKTYGVIAGTVDEYILETCTQLYARDRYVKILKQYGVEAINFKKIQVNGYGYRDAVNLLRPYFTKDGALQVGELINIANETSNGLKAIKKKLQAAGMSQEEIKLFFQELRSQFL